MGDKLWKATERAIARRLGGVRTGNRGVAGPDVISGWLSASAEVKVRQRLPRWLLEGMAQAERNAAPGTLPVLILHRKGQRHDNDLVVMRLANFEQRYGNPIPGEDIGEEVAE